MRKLLNKAVGSLSSSCLFPHTYKVYFKPEEKICPDCNSTLKVMKTATKTMITLHIGKFNAHITSLICRHCENKTVYICREPQTLVPEFCNVGYDILVYVGINVYEKYRTAKEISTDLQSKNVFLSDSEIYFLAKKFLTYLEIAHQESGPKIKKFMQESGGYILHIDGTCNGKSQHLITVIDAISGFVLDSIKIPTENSTQIIPMLQKISETYGKPLAVVSDMGRALILALTTVFNNIPHFICHFHFLRDIGKDLLLSDYDVLRKQLQAYGISSILHKHIRSFEEITNKDSQIAEQFFANFGSDKSCNIQICESSLNIFCQSLLQWALKGKTQGNGYGFPFDRPYLIFYQRLIIVYNSLSELTKRSLSNNKNANKTVLRLMEELDPLVYDKSCQSIMTNFLDKIEVFDKLREVMRMAPIDGKKGLNDSGQINEIKTIEKGVRTFYSCLINKYSENGDYKKMIKQIKKYWNKLFSDPIIVRICGKDVKIQPQRTNNIMEQFFRKLKRIFLRKSGANSMTETLETILPSVTFVNNLKNNQYMKILLNGKETLEERFADIDSKIIRKKLGTNCNNNCSENIHKITEDIDFPQKLMQIFS